jgi:Rod binding domain-containing protein
MVNRIGMNQPVVAPKTSKDGMSVEDQKLLKACKDFESILALQMVQAMQGSTKMFRDGFGGPYFQSMFQEQMAKQMTEGNGLGIAHVLFNQLKKGEDGK